MAKLKPRKHKLWITLTDEAYNRILIEQRRIAPTSPSRVTSSVIINQLILNALPEQDSRARRTAAAGAPLGDARRGDLQ